MDERFVIQVLLGEFQDKLTLLKEMIPREAEFPAAPNKIKVAIGMRRTGKTYFLYQHILKLLKTGVNIKSILYINFEDDRLFPLNEKKLAALVDAFYSLYPENHDRKCFLFFDEIQNVSNWSLVIRRLHDTKNCEIFLTGSSAKLLSKEIATSLRGRSLATEIWPYNFAEFARAQKVTIDRTLFDKKTHDKMQHLFLSYLSDGGFPETLAFSRDDRQTTLQEYLDVVIYRDIIERHDIKHPTLIKYMILSMIHNIGKPFAINKFYNDIRSQGYKIGKDLIYDYAAHVEDAYLVFHISLYDASSRKSTTHPKKLYAVDNGLIRALTLDYEDELGRLFENVVYLDLRRRGYEVNYYLTSSRQEVDFIAQSPQGRRKLFQVTWDMTHPLTMEREERALAAGMKELRVDGAIITLESYLREGIQF